MRPAKRGGGENSANEMKAVRGRWFNKSENILAHMSLDSLSLFGRIVCKNKNKNNSNRKKWTGKKEENSDKTLP